jgi:DNA (cytosine-5)-methyltransferase 3A
LHEAKPKFFVYENNKSMSKAIRESIDKAFGFEAICINSALVSAQNRQRLYRVGKRNEDGTYSRVNVEQPEDRGILLRDILESGYSCVADPVNVTADGKGQCLRATYYKDGIRNMVGNTIDRKTCVAEPVPGYATPCEWDENGKPIKAISATDGKTYQVYEVKDGHITIKDKQYQIKLADGFYIIRKLTVRECMRLQTVPEWYEFPVSNSRAYAMLGNGWTCGAIEHLLRGCMATLEQPAP